jgi:PKD repeat protein
MVVLFEPSLIKPRLTNTASTYMSKFHFCLILFLFSTCYCFKATAQTLTPDQLPNLVVWLRADSVEKDGSNKVSSWPNKIGVNPFNQTDLNKQPTWVDNVWNGKPVIRFDGSNDVLNAGNSYNIGTNSRTIFIVARSNVNTNYGLYAKSIDNNVPYRFALLGINGPTLLYYHDSQPVANYLYSTSIPVGFNIWSSVMDRTSQQLKSYKNGTLAGPTISGIDATGNFTSPYRFLVGAYNDGADQGEQFYLNGDIAEMIVFDRALSDSERSQMERYLQVRYTRQVTLGPDILQNGFCPITLTESSGFSSYMWSTTSTGNSITVTESGNYWVSATDSFGMRSIDSIQVTFAQNFIIPDTILCAGNSLSIGTGLMPPYTFAWSNFANTPSINVSQPGQYVIRVTDTAGCVRRDTFLVAVDSLPYLISLGPDTSLCSGNIIGLQRGDNLVNGYDWSVGTQTPTIAVTSSGNYSLTVSNSHGCTATDNISVSISGYAPTVSFMADTPCEGVPTSFTDQSTYFPAGVSDSLLVWDFGGGNTGTGATPFFTFNGWGQFNVTLTVTSTAGCKNSATQTVTVYENPTVNFALPLNGCVSNPYSFVANAHEAAGDVITQYNWSFGDASPNSLSPTPLHSYTTSGSKVISLTVTTQRQCSASFSDTLLVVDSALIPSTFLLQLPLNSGIGISGATTFSWTASNGASSYTLQIADDASFINILDSVVIIGQTCTINLVPRVYYWRVFANNVCSQATPSEVRSFELIDLPSLGPLPLWLKADGSVIKDSLSNNVSSWVNSIAGPAFVQPLGSKQPKWVDNVWNGRPVIRFSGDDFLNAGNSYNEGTNSRTIFLVGQSRVSSVGAFLAKSEDDLAARGRFAFLYYNDSPDGLLFYYDDVTTHRLYSGPNAAGANIWSSVIDRTGQDLQLFQNSIPKANEPGISSSTDFNLPYRFLIGAYNDPADQSEYHFLNGDIAEIIIYDSALPDSSRYQVEQYLRFKYAPQINLGPDIDVKYGVCGTVLDAGVPFTNYRWNTGETTRTINVVANGTYWVTANDIFGYITTDTVVVNVPYRGATVTDTIVCIGDSIQITQLISPLNAYTFLWQNGATSNSIYASADGIYTATISDTIGCHLTVSSRLRIDSFSLFSLFPNDTLSGCTGNNISLPSFQYPYQNYLWTTPSTPPNTSTLSEVTIDSAGSYKVRVSDIHQCVARDTVYVNRKWYAPHTDFTAGQVCLGDSFSFVNLTDSVPPDRINLWQWSFGDADSSNFQSPTHLYLSTGPYPVSLFLTTDSGCTGFKLDTVNVYPQPHANFSNTPLAICAGTSVLFQNVSTLDLPDSLFQNWTFNNTDLFTDSNVVYTFLNEGQVPVTLIVYSNHGCADSVSQLLPVFSPLIAGFAVDSVCLGSTTVFTNLSQSFSSLTWQWSFGDGSFSSPLENPTHKYQAANTYHVVLTVSNTIGCVDTATRDVKIAAIPVAAFTVQNACEGFLYTPQNNSVFLNDSIVAWQWEIDTSTYNIKSPQHLFTKAGDFPVTLLVTSESGCQNSVTHNVVINPNSIALFGFSPLYGEAPLVITFNNQSSGASSYQWNFGDGGSSAQRNPVYTYMQNGSYDISLTVSSDSGCTSSSVRNIIVTPTQLDLSLDLVQATQTPQANGYVSLQATVTMSNLGTRTISSARLYAILGNGGVINEMWTDSMPAGAQRQHIFTAAFIASPADANSYLCVNAEEVNGGEIESRIDNNRVCTSLSGTIQLIGPVPNPVSDRSVLGIILPKAGKVSVAIADVAGQYVMEETELSLPAGRSDIEIPAYRMSAAEYFIRVKYNDDKFVRKFVVKK